MQNSELLTEQVTNLKQQNQENLKKLENDLDQKHNKINANLQKSLLRMKNEIGEKSVAMEQLSSKSDQQKTDLGTAEGELKLLDDDIRFLLEVGAETI